MMEYNTARSKLVIREYGRNVHKLVEAAQKQVNKIDRQKLANAVVELMGFLNNANKNLEDFKHKLWNHLFVIANFKLDVESPYPIPTAESVGAKPECISYPRRYPKFLHLGKNIELLIQKAIVEEDDFKKQYITQIIMNYLRIAYNTWHKDNAQEESLKSELLTLSKGKLVYESNPTIKQMLQQQRGTDTKFHQRKNNSGIRNNNSKKHKHKSFNNRFSKKKNFR